MSTPLVDAAQQFYADLGLNNTKQWWEENRATYDDVLKPDALALLDRLAQPVSALIGHPVTTKLFRPYRDVRFSKDKTPYQTHLHMMWQVQDPDARQSPVYFFGIGTDYVTAGAGLMGFDKPVLEDWRKFVDLDGPRISGIIDTLTTGGYGLREPALKRVPAPFPADHPLGGLLRMKGIVASREIGASDDLDAALIATFCELTPLNTLLLQVAG